ncbi:MAG: energy-coupling factor ABC transporter ATP-binding protein, partial [Candidatus Omnitrophica bacterium]|nr:energy-coupling factor ABC transporter ATP-binding protein [Candidatus Omnitrophota bacterium]
KKNLKAIRRMVGLVFQDPDDQLFMPTVFEDVAFGPLNLGLDEETVKICVDKALAKVDMRDKADRFSYHLSFGEKKRISIATVLSMNPEILILDEPTGNLDHKHRRNLINLLKELRLTKIIATHDLDLVLEICARVVLLDNGKIVADGNTLTILRNKELLEAHNLEVPPSFVIFSLLQSCLTPPLVNGRG